MIYISHRGYIDGVDKKVENNPESIKFLLEKNVHVEIDIRYYKNSFYLGHDEPKFKVQKNFLEHKNLWCHAKDAKALDELRNLNCHYFWHQEDDYTITNKGFIWVYPGKPLLKNCIAVLPESFKQELKNCHGICTDNIKKYVKYL